MLNFRKIYNPRCTYCYKQMSFELRCRPPIVGIRLYAMAEEILALCTQVVGNFGQISHADFEHDLYLVLELRPRSLATDHKSQISIITG